MKQIIFIFITIISPYLAYAEGCTDNVVYPGQCTIVHISVAQEGTVTDYNTRSVTGYNCGSFTSVQKGTNNTVYKAGKRACLNIYRFVSGAWMLQTQNYWWIQNTDYPALLTTIGSGRYYENTYANHPAIVYPTGIQGCGNACLAKTGQSNYKLDIRNEGTPANLASSCYEDCKTTAEELWEDCISGQCVSSIKHTFTGDTCSGQPAISDLEPSQPDRCNDEIEAKIAACGGSLNVYTFDFQSCTGTCTPDSCSDAYALKIQSCGGVMAIASWDDKTCKGTCVSDPLPPQEPGPTDQPPYEIKREEVVNSDGSKEETRTTTQYNSETNTTYTTTTNTTYNSSGLQTGQKTSTTISPGKPNGEGQGEEPGESETFAPIGSSGFGEAYTLGGEYDIPVRFNTFLNTVKSSGLFSFSSGFFNSIPGGGSPVFTINGGQTFGTHTIDLSENMTTGLALLKSTLMACFGFLSIRAIIMKR